MKKQDYILTAFDDEIYTNLLDLVCSVDDNGILHIVEPKRINSNFKEFIYHININDEYDITTTDSIVDISNNLKKGRNEINIGLTATFKNKPGTPKKIYYLIDKSLKYVVYFKIKDHKKIISFENRLVLPVDFSNRIKMQNNLILNFKNTDNDKQKVYYWASSLIKPRQITIESPDISLHSQEIDSVRARPIDFVLNAPVFVIDGTTLNEKNIMLWRIGTTGPTFSKTILKRLKTKKIFLGTKIIKGANFDVNIKKDSVFSLSSLNDEKIKLGENITVLLLENFDDIIPDTMILKIASALRAKIDIIKSDYSTLEKEYKIDLNSNIDIDNLQVSKRVFNELDNILLNSLDDLFLLEV